MDDTKLEELKATARGKIRSVLPCDWCNGPHVVSNSRERIKLCPRCSRNRGVITGAFKRHGSFQKGKMTEAEKQKVVDSRTVGYGSRNWKTTKPKGVTE